MIDLAPLVTMYLTGNLSKSRMDSLEIISNCSETSDGGSSNLSTLSGLSTYKDEFLELSHLVNPDKHPQFSKTPWKNGRHGTVALHIEERVKSLTNQLNQALKLNEKLKCEAYNVEKRTELRFNEKIEKLVRHNNHLQSNLKSANVQINRLISNCCLKNENTQISKLQTKILSLEKSTHQANLWNSSLESEIFHCNRDKSDFQLENEQIKLELNDLRLEFSAKNNCISELKVKVSEQHVQVQNGLRTNLKFSNSINALTNELDCARKSENWYKQKLHQCQSDKATLLNEVVCLKKSLAAQNDTIEELKVEVSKWKYKYEEKELEWLQEKKTILETLEEAVQLKPQQYGSKSIGISNIESNQNSLITYYESIVSDLKAEIEVIRINIEEQILHTDKLNKDNATLITKCANLQKELEMKEYNCDTIENERKCLEMKLNILGDKDMEIMALNNAISNLKIDLDSKNRENEIIIDSVRGIKEQFKAFKSNYENLKSEICQKSKENLKLQEEKQKLFMSNNWKTCELEKRKERDLEVQKLQQELLISIQNENKWKFEATKCQNELDRLKISLDKRNSDETDEVNSLKSLLLEKEKSFEDLKDDLVILKNEIHERDRKIHNLSSLSHDFISKINQIEPFDFEKRNSNINGDTNCSSKIQESLIFLKSQIASKDSSLRNLKTSLNKIKSEFANRLEILEKRNSDLHRKCDENLSLLLNLNESNFENTPDQIRNLHALLQVKSREQKEKQKKYETNYRTLLTKVKDHMKYRNAAEKHNIYLQELYNTLSDEHNSLKLQLSSNDFHLKALENLIEEHRKINERQKITISSLEDQLNNLNNCEKCNEFDLITAKIKTLEDFKRDKEQMIDLYRNQVEEKNKEIMFSRLERSELSQSVINSKKEIELYIKKIESINEINEELKHRAHQLEEQLEAKQNENSENLKEKDINTNLIVENQSISKALAQVQDKNAYFFKELEILKSEFKLKSDQLLECQRQNDQLVSNGVKKEAEMGNLLVALKTQLMAFKHETESTKNEKYFLQRLCNDLKVALKVHVARNKLLQEQLSALCKEKQEFSSLPTSLLPDLPAPVKFDDDYINRLLQENRAPLKDKPLSDIQVCLDALKKEVSVLQKQVVEKSMFGNNNR